MLYNPLVHIYSVCKMILKSCNLLIETHRLVEWQERTTPQRNATLNNLGQDFMDLRSFFLVSIQWLVGVTMDVLFDACNETFLSNNGRGSMSSGYIPIEAATCVFWSSNNWHILNTFVGHHTTLACPTLSQCNSSKTFSWRWMNGMLPVSKGIEYKQFCEINATGCCENKTSMKISACLPVSVYFNRNSTGCVEAHCYVNEPDVNNTLGTNMSSVNNRNETYRCANTSSAGIPIWTTCLIAILIASNICLTLGLVLLWLKVNLQRKTHDVTDPAQTHRAQTQTFDDQAQTQTDGSNLKETIKTREKRIG
ncbi:uncharacterized protein LOC128155876 isoform X1 [Crassostrea angulata]|uniref:uncharacterized protein LOC128155876 isoform X1 n=1 Tax=Magallana angulata TaxID=2784310 RepID=UPI0022B0EA5E|nr:uncharacterized protein LOC128155876 isoform X1 [Crassostrea angulata]